jgi:hypothetical protein
MVFFRLRLGGLTPSPFPRGKGNNRVVGSLYVRGCALLTRVVGTPVEIARFGQDDEQKTWNRYRLRLREAVRDPYAPRGSLALVRMTEGERRSIASPFENTQGRLCSFGFGQDDTKKDALRRDLTPFPSGGGTIIGGGESRERRVN